MTQQLLNQVDKENIRQEVLQAYPPEGSDPTKLRFEPKSVQFPMKEIDPENFPLRRNDTTRTSFSKRSSAPTQIESNNPYAHITDE